MPNTQLANIYLICSDDPLLKMERSQEIIGHWHDQDPQAEFLLYTFSELQSTGSGGPNLKNIENEMSDPGLFADSRIIKIILKDLDNTAIELFKLIAANFRRGLYVIIELPIITTKLAESAPKDPSALRRLLSFVEGSAGSVAIAAKELPKTKGKKTTTAKPKAAKTTRARGDNAKKAEAIGYLRFLGAQVERLYTPDGVRLLEWIQRRADQYGFKLYGQALDFVARSCDNNLLTINHSLQVLSMMQEHEPNQKINLTLEMAEAYFIQDSRYTGYELPVAIFNNDPLRALNIISSFCSGGDTSADQAISLLLSRMDSSLTTIYEGKKLAIDWSRNSTDRQAFLLSHNFKVTATQTAVVNAIRMLSEEQLHYLTQCLSEASCFYASFDYDGAYRALQRMALATSNPRGVHFLSAELFT